jgi:hypothetical protein
MRYEIPLFMSTSYVTVRELEAHPIRQSRAVWSVLSCPDLSPQKSAPPSEDGYTDLLEAKAAG